MSGQTQEQHTGNKVGGCGNIISFTDSVARMAKTTNSFTRSRSMSAAALRGNSVVYLNEMR